MPRSWCPTPSRRLGRLDIVVVNAGIWNAKDAPIETLGERDWDEMIRVNLKSAYGVTHYAAAQMIAQKSGRIIVRQLDGGPARRSLPFSLRGEQGRGDQLRQIARDRAGAARHSGELRGARVGGYGYVPAGAGDERGSEVCHFRHSAGARGHGSGDCRTDSLFGFGSGNLCDRGSTQCKWRCGAVRIKRGVFDPGNCSNAFGAGGLDL